MTSVLFCKVCVTGPLPTLQLTSHRSARPPGWSHSYDRGLLHAHLEWSLHMMFLLPGIFCTSPSNFNFPFKSHHKPYSEELSWTTLPHTLPSPHTDIVMLYATNSPHLTSQPGIWTLINSDRVCLVHPVAMTHRRPAFTGIGQAKCLRVLGHFHSFLFFIHKRGLWNCWLSFFSFVGQFFVT